jgi:hypothetical protein
MMNDVLYDLYFLPNVIPFIKSSIKWTVNVTCMGESRGAYRVLVRKTDGKKPLGRPELRWEDNIKKWFQEIQ